MIFPRNFLRILMKYVDPVKRRRNINSGRYFRFADLTSDIFFSGPVLEILNSSLGFVYSVGSYLSIECMYRSQNQLGTKKEKEKKRNRLERKLCKNKYVSTTRNSFQLPRTSEWTQKSVVPPKVHWGKTKAEMQKQRDKTKAEMH